MMIIIMYNDNGHNNDNDDNNNLNHTSLPLHGAQDMPGQMPSSPLKQQAYGAGAEAWGAY